MSKKYGYSYYERYVHHLFDIGNIESIKNFTLLYNLDNIYRYDDCINIVIKCIKQNVKLDDELIEYVSMKTCIANINNIPNKINKDHELVVIYLLSVHITENTNKSNLHKYFMTACKNCDEILFNCILLLFVDDDLDLSQEHLIYAIKNGSSFMVTKLLQKGITPILPTIDVLSKEILDLLIHYGLPINIDTIEKALCANLEIDLQKYDFTDNEKIFDLCRKYEKFNFYQNINQIMMSKYMCIINNMNNWTSQELYDYIKTCGIMPDNVIYNLAVKYEHDNVVEYLETKYGMLPSLEALVLIDDKIRQKAYMSRLVEVHNLPKNIISSFAVT